MRWTSSFRWSDRIEPRATSLGLNPSTRVCIGKYEIAAKIIMAEECSSSRRNE